MFCAVRKRSFDSLTVSVVNKIIYFTIYCINSAAFNTQEKHLKNHSHLNYAKFSFLFFTAIAEKLEKVWGFPKNLDHKTIFWTYLLTNMPNISNIFDVTLAT